MLDADLKEQLKTVFLALENSVGIEYHSSTHSQQTELLDLLKEIQECSPKIVLQESQSVATIPSFRIHHQSQPTGIFFKGIPGGHEFSSLVLAILNADRKGKFPDALTQNRIARIKGPVRLKTYISLSCENCPEVVQALNLMTLTHPDFEHTMIDGGFVPEEIEKLNIQGVPSVVVGNELIHSGRIQMIDLLDKLEKYFGTVDEEIAERDLGHFDTVVVGGGPAGVAAAIYSARKGLKTIIITERLGGQVKDTVGIENFISMPYTEGSRLVGNFLEHLKAYPIEILENQRVTKIDKMIISLNSKAFLQASSIIIATGAKWRELGVPGEKEYVGKGVAYCPHCDGPFYKGKRVAVMGGGNSGIEAAIDLAGIVSHVTVFEYTDKLKADQVLVEKLKNLPNVHIITNAKTLEINGDGKKVVSLSYQDQLSLTQNKIELEGVFVQIGLVPNTQFLKGVVELTAFGEIVVDTKGRTSTPGIYAAGDVTTIPYKQIITALGDGSKVALAVFEDRMTGRN